MNKKNINISEKKIVNYFENKNRFYLNLLKKIFYKFNNNKNINFININLINNFSIELSIKDIIYNINNYFMLIITIYIKNKFTKFIIKNSNYNNIIKEINYNIKILKYYTSDNIFTNIPDYNIMCHKIKKLKLFYPIEDDFQNRLNILNNVKNNILYLYKNKNYSKIKNMNFYSNYKYIANINTYNILNYYNTSYHEISCQFLSKKNKLYNQKYDYINCRSLDFLKNINNFGIKSYKETFLELNSSKLKSNKYKIILINSVSTNLFYDFSESINGKYIYLKSTYLLNYLNKQIFPSWMNIIENPNIKKGLGSSSFDNEGIKSNKKFIIKNGILKTWILNSFYSYKLNLNNTGNANGIYNWKFNINYNITFKQLIEYANDCILINNFIGCGLNICTGDYSQGVSGFFIKNGKFLYPVSEIIISGNMIDIFENILLMSNDFENRNIISSGSLLINNITISGI